MPFSTRLLACFFCVIGVALATAACGEAAPGHKRGPTEPYASLPLGAITSGTEIAEAIGSHAPSARYCGAIGFVDLGSAEDGPAYYFRKSDGKIIGRCGGICMADPSGHCKTDCPPAGWTCRRR
jgi:hypothetical protein